MLIDWLAFRFPRVERWISPPPLLLVRNGVVLRRNLRQEMMTEEELLSHLRQQGIEHIADVKKAFMEPDGRVSVVANTAAAQQHRPEKTAPAGR